MDAFQCEQGQELDINSNTAQDKLYCLPICVKQCTTYCIPILRSTNQLILDFLHICPLKLLKQFLNYLSECV